MRGLIVLAAASLCAACAGLDRVPPAKAAEEVVSERSYALGRSETAHLGDRLVRVRNYRVVVSPAAKVRADRDFTLAGGIDRIHFKAGEALPIVGRRVVNGKTVLVADKDQTFLVQVGEDGRIRPRVLTDLGFGVRTPMLASFRVRPPEAKLEPVRSREIDPKSFGENYDLLFSGVDTRTLRLTYREYWRDNLDRPALQQDLSFPADADVIRFRKLVIEVKSADPGALTYVVRSDG